MPLNERCSPWCFPSTLNCGLIVIGGQRGSPVTAFFFYTAVLRMLPLVHLRICSVAPSPMMCDIDVFGCLLVRDVCCPLCDLSPLFSSLMSSLRSTVCRVSAAMGVFVFLSGFFFFLQPRLDRGSIVTSFFWLKSINSTWLAYDITHTRLACLPFVLHCIVLAWCVGCIVLHFSPQGVQAVVSKCILHIRRTYSYERTVHFCCELMR